MLFYVLKTIKVMTEQNLTVIGKVTEPYSIMRAIKQKFEGQEPEGIYKEMNECGKAEFSPQRANSNTIYIPMQGTDNILLPPLRNRLVLTRAGATITAGLKPYIPILIHIPVFTSTWGVVNERDLNNGGLKDFRPHCLVSQVNIPRRLLGQDVLAFEPMLRSLLVESIAQALEDAILGNGQASNWRPGGLFNNVTNTVEVSWSEIGKLETVMDAANVLDKNCSYIMHTKLYRAAKAISQTDTMPSTGMPVFVLDGWDTYMNGQPAFYSNNVYADADNGKYGILFGSFEDLFIGQWGHSNSLFMGN
jgi:hypothetical protein